MSHVLKHNVADQIAYFRAYNTDGSAKTDLTSATTGLTLSVFRVGAASVSIASLSDKAADDSTHADGAIRAVGGNLYTIDIPDAATATQVPSIVVRGSYTGGVVEGLEHPIVAYDPAVNYASATKAADIETDTQDLQSRLPSALVSGRIDASVGAMAADTLTASALASDAVTEIQSGLALQTTSLAIKAKTDLITAGAVTYTSPVAASGKISIPIIIGDDYLAANTRAFEWTITARSGVVVGTASCRFGGTNEELNKSWLVTGTVSDIGGGQWKLSFDLDKTATGALAEGYYRWSVELLSAGGTEITEVFSGRNVEVRNKQT